MCFLKGKVIQRNQETERSSTCWVTLQMLAAARTGWGQSKERDTPNRSPAWVAGNPAPESCLPLPRHALAGSWIRNSEESGLSQAPWHRIRHPEWLLLSPSCHRRCQKAHAWKLVGESTFLLCENWLWFFSSVPILIISRSFLVVTN